MRTAVALNYDPLQHEAPQVSSVGRCEVASEMERIARRYGITIVEDAELANQLIETPVPEAIPSKLYHAVATLLVRNQQS